MGNCLRHDPEVHWGGEDWSPAMPDSEKSTMKKEEEQHGYATSNVKEVKVKITKKQLENLLEKMDLQQQGFSTEQILAQLVKVSVHYESHHRSWKPRLQSIPEL